MRIFIKILFLLFYGGIISGQNNDVILSLESALNTHQDDTVRVRLLKDLALQYKTSDTVYAKKLLEESYTISSDLSYQLGKGWYYESLGKIRFHYGQFQQAIHLFEKAKTHFKKLNDYNRYTSVLVDQGNAFLYISEYANALEKYELALEISREHNNKSCMCRCLNNLGIIYKNYGEYEKALKSYMKVIELYMADEKKNQLADVYINIGVVFVLQGKYKQALENFNHALNSAEISGNLKQQTISLMNSGVIHHKMSNYQKAHEYYEKALGISTTLNDKLEISKILTNIGTNYISQEKYKLAEDYIRRGLKLKKELGDKNSIANCYNFLAEINFHLNNYTEALDLDRKGIELKRIINDPEGLARGYSNLSRTYLALGDEKNAMHYTDSSLYYGLPIHALEHIASAYYIKKLVFAVNGQYKKAYDYGELYRMYSDSLLNEIKIKAVNELEFRYHAQILKKENERLRNQYDLSSNLISRHRKLIFTFLLAFLMTLISILLLIIIQRKQKHYNNLLENKNHIITKQNISLDSINKTKDKILSVITHDLRGTIGNQLTALSVLSKGEFKDDEERKLVFSRLAHSATLSLEILENLTLWTNIQEKLIQYNPENARLDETARDVIEVFNESILSKEISLKNEIKNEVSCVYDEFMMKSVMKNLLSNAIKFSKRGGTIHFGITADENHAEVYIKDFGTGIPPGEISSILAGTTLKTKRGTENEKGSGLGLSIVKSFLLVHNVELNIESSQAHGTVVSFKLPMKDQRA